MNNPRIIQQRNSSRRRLSAMTALPSFLAASAHADTAGSAAPGGTVQSLLDALGIVAGNWVHAEAFAGISLGQLLLGAGFLLIVAIGIQVSRRALRYATQKCAPPAQGVGSHSFTWLKQPVEALIPPLTLFVWVWGVYAALALISAHVTARNTLLADVMRWLKNAGEIIALFWFVFRMIRVVELQLRSWAATTDSKWDDVMVAVTNGYLRRPKSAEYL